MDLPDFQNARRWWKAFKEWPLKYRILIVAVAAAVVCISVFRPLIKNFLSRERTKVPERPMFFLTNPNIRVGSRIIIVAENTSANLNRTLKVEYDGIVFPHAGIPISDSNPQQWYFTLHDKELPGEMLKEGAHELRFSFLG